MVVPEIKHCIVGLVVFITSFSLLFKLLFLDTYARSCRGAATRILLLDGGPHFSRCWGLIARFFPRNCPQIKGVASINGISLMESLHSVTGSVRVQRSGPLASKSWDISEWPSQLQSSCGLIWSWCITASWLSFFSAHPAALTCFRCCSQRAPLQWKNLHANLHLSLSLGNRPTVRCSSGPQK